jgi:hypothetical protein
MFLNAILECLRVGNPRADRRNYREADVLTDATNNRHPRTAITMAITEPEVALIMSIFTLVVNRTARFIIERC